MEKRDLKRETKRVKTAERRANESNEEKILRRESDRLRIASKRQLVDDNLEEKQLRLESNRLRTADHRAIAPPEHREIRLESNRLRTTPLQTRVRMSQSRETTTGFFFTQLLFYL